MILKNKLIFGKIKKMIECKKYKNKIKKLLKW